MTITFTSHDSKKTLGTAEMKNGKLTGSTPGIQQMIDGKKLTMDMDDKKAEEFFGDWSNGYIVSKKTG